MKNLNEQDLYTTYYSFKKQKESLITSNWCIQRMKGEETGIQIP